MNPEEFQRLDGSFDPYYPGHAAAKRQAQELLADLFAIAAEEIPEDWIATTKSMGKTRLRLKAKNYLVATPEHQGVWLSLPKDCSPESIPGLGWNQCKKDPIYGPKNNPSAHLCINGTIELPLEDQGPRQFILKQFRALMRLLAEKKESIRKVNLHDDAALEYLETETGRTLPRPEIEFGETNLPEEIEHAALLNAIETLKKGGDHLFAESTGYNVLHEGERFPPKAVVGLAAQEVTGRRYGPYDFKGGLGSQCFRILEKQGFLVVPKLRGGCEAEQLVEGAAKSVTVNRFERNQKAKEECKRHYGTSCAVCKLSMEARYGEIGRDYIHVHHLTPMSEIGEEYVVDPIRDLRPVCPNCHEMLHRQRPPLSIEELQAIMENLPASSDP